MCFLFTVEKLKKYLSEEIVDVLTLISENAFFYDIKAYIVGGAVRDLILQQKIYDVDLVVEGNAIEFCNYLQAHNVCKITKINEDFGTVKVMFSNGIETDIASTRKEIYPQAGHLPKVTEIGCNLELDIQRRDFTVNTIVLSLNKNNFGEIIDFYNGADDINKKQLTVLHAQSFVDDPTRIIRGLRFARKCDFKLDTFTQELQDDYLEKFNSDNICYERIKQVTKLAFDMNSASLYNDFIDKKIYKLLTLKPLFIDGLAIKEKIDKYKKEIQFDVWLVYLACLIEAEDAQKLNLNNKELNLFDNLKILMNTQIALKSNSEIYHAFKNKPVESLIAYEVLTNCREVYSYLFELRHVRLELSGQDLLNMGYEQNKFLGHVLNELLSAKLNKLITTKNDEIAYAEGFLFNQLKDIH